MTLTIIDSLSLSLSVFRLLAIVRFFLFTLASLLYYFDILTDLSPLFK